MKLSEKLKELRTSKKLNQSDVADILKIDRSTYGKYETGDSSPDYEKLIKLADLFDCSVDYLLGRTDIKTPIETIAAHHDGDDWTEEELEDIEKFKEFVRSKRDKRKLF
ncbi:MAG: helix-turn-helix transcriptional regulator [Peptococcaceae bacterium]|nr:helix-turn-helix domain-containing protein [Peptococcaceae bacterium]MDH7525252.1 helix-turn-helix transcriptional regulator [Peptococcaceae bacterium]